MHIPSQHIEIERIYSQVLGEGKRSIAISSANSGEGVSSLAQALVQRNLLAGHSTLLVDLNLHHPSLSSLLKLDESEQEADLLDKPQLVTVQQSIALTGVTPPTHRSLVMKLRKPGVLEQYIAEWQQTYDAVIFDTSPINRTNANNIPPERVAAACDGSLLVVLAGSTTEAMVSTAVNKLNAAGAQLLACIYNDRDNSSLKSELLRELHRLEPRFSNISHRLKNWVQQNQLLSMET
ncbi:MAG: protein SypD [Gammaproteobacteria bacterium]|nr:protein SypD [Gammaproteobacteria bacterium]MCF6259438.1 protein SypD [Gammaproteobacteria bacterium]